MSKQDMVYGVLLTDEAWNRSAGTIREQELNRKVHLLP